ncbi:uncharacterized protein LOC132630996 [Lycium barbarum]|uniref:uncharacterized protein LOC132630996 n=1 Tax=Lycium barbarum TaxID=112863 RepID=UPI00293ED5FC|nr:uncharacterized protein LOC132630996 [Lycium barbarum]
MDIIVGLLNTLGKLDSIWVIVDRLTKPAHFIPVQITYTAQKLAQIYIRGISELGTRLDLGTAFHLQTDGQSEGKIQVLEDMRRACVIDFGGHWDQFLPLEKFACNNSFHSSIDMAPFEALYGRRCRYPFVWFDAFEVRPWGTDLLRESLYKVKVIKENLLAAQSWQKEYTDRKVRDLEFMVGGLSGVRPVFHAYMLKRYHGDGSFIIRGDSVLLDENLSCEEDPIAILDREVCKLRSKEIASVKVPWKNRSVDEATWGTKSDMRPQIDVGNLGEKPELTGWMRLLQRV